MASTAVAFPILPNKMEEGRAFCAECNGPRRAEMRQAMDRWGESKASWYIQENPQGGGLIVVYAEGDDLLKSFQVWAKSDHPFDVWFKSTAGAVCGMDFNQPVSSLPEMAFSI